MGQDRHSILGIDAAWTQRGTSGVALVVGAGTSWQCVAVSPSYDAFIGLARGQAVHWHSRPVRGFAASLDILDAAQRLARAPIDIIAVDMPVSTLPITERREADRKVSQTFGARKISTHSPTADRPGQFGAQLVKDFNNAGYALATSGERAGTERRLVEVYPHPALLSLLHCASRVPYKVAKSAKYWPTETLVDRVKLLLQQHQRIYGCLRNAFGTLPFVLPTKAHTLSELKRYEDALDALICCWVGTLYLSGKAVAYGDRTAAIWCPEDDA